MAFAKCTRSAIVSETRMCREVFDLASSRQQKTNSATHQKDCIRYHFDGSGTKRAQPKRSGMRPCRSHEHWFRCGPTANSKVGASASDSAPTSPGDGGCF